MESRLHNWWNRPSGGREVWRLAAPLVVSSLSWTVMGFTDRMFLLWDSEAAMAAALPSLALWWMVLCIPLGVCMYVNTFVSQYFGAKRWARIGPATWQGMWLALAASPLVFATVPMAAFIFYENAPSAEVARLEFVYYEVLCWCAPPMLLGQALGSFFTGRGLTRVVMVVDAFSAGLNVLLDYLWIFGHAGFPEMGIAGAGWATVVANAVKAAVLFALFLRAGNRTRFHTAQWRFNSPLFARLVRFGGPSGVQMMLEVAGFTVFIVAMGQFGKLEQAATNLTFNVAMLAFMPIFGLSIAAGIIVGQRLGEDAPDLAARGTWTTCTMSLVYMAVISVFYLLTPDVFLFGYFAQANADDPQRLRQTTVVLLRFVAAYNLFDALNMVFAGAVKGAGDTRFVMIVSGFMSLILAGGVYLCVHVIDAGLYGSWAFVTVWLCVLGVIYFTRFLHGKWRSMRVIESEADPTADEPSSTEAALSPPTEQHDAAEVEYIAS